MKLVARILKIIPLSCFILIASCTDHDIENGGCRSFNVPGTYTYPVTFQSDAWFDLRSLEEKVNACQIPDNVLDSISTEALLETLLNYPLLNDFAAFDVMQRGFERIKSEQDGFGELYGRSDLFDVVTDRYNKMSVHCNDTYPPFVNGTAVASIGFMCLEFMMFQDEFLNALNREQQLQLFKAVSDKLQQKNTLPDQYKDFSKWLSFALLGKIMFKNEFKPFIEFCRTEPFMEFFVQQVPGYRPSTLDLEKAITTYASQYLAMHG
jgi:hypothetical protein